MIVTFITVWNLAVAGSASEVEAAAISVRPEAQKDGAGI
jgi:hypothetical protein